MSTFAIHRIGGLALVMLIAGCSANHKSIYHKKTLAAAQPSLVTVDAKQRAILAVPKDRKLRFCSEPSPDVFSVVAQALSAGGTFGQSADPKTIQLALNAAFSSSEQGSSIPRTQTINMLRELMYRTCERYINGGLSETELPIQAVRDQRLMVSILAIEQLTGAVAPKPVAIGSSTSGSAGSSGSDAVVRMDESYKALQTKAEAETNRQSEYNEINGDSGKCVAIADLVEAGKEADLTDDQNDDRPKCEAAASALASAKLAHAAAASHYTALKEAASIGGIPVSVTTDATDRSAAGGIDRAHSVDLVQVASVVKSIVEMNFDQDEFLLFCLKALSKDGTAGIVSPDITDILTACTKHVESGIMREAAQSNLQATQIELQAARNKVTAEEILKATAEYKVRTADLFGTFWDAVKSAGDSDVADAAKLSARLGAAALSQSEKDCFANAGTGKQAIEACFDSVRSQQKYQLEKGS